MCSLPPPIWSRSQRISGLLLATAEITAAAAHVGAVRPKRGTLVEEDSTRELSIDLDDLVADERLGRVTGWAGAS